MEQLKIPMGKHRKHEDGTFYFDKTSPLFDKELVVRMLTMENEITVQLFRVVAGMGPHESADDYFARIERGEFIFPTVPAETENIKQYHPAVEWFVHHILKIFGK